MSSFLVQGAGFARFEAVFSAKKAPILNTFGPPLGLKTLSKIVPKIGRFVLRFLDHFGSILIHFGPHGGILGAFLTFLDHFEPFLIHFGPHGGILGAFWVSWGRLW